MEFSLCQSTGGRWGRLFCLVQRKNPICHAVNTMGRQIPAAIISARILFRILLVLCFISPPPSRLFFYYTFLDFFVKKCLSKEISAFSLKFFNSLCHILNFWIVHIGNGFHKIRHISGNVLQNPQISIKTPLQSDFSIQTFFPAAVSGIFGMHEKLLHTLRKIQKNCSEGAVS